LPELPALVLPNTSNSMDATVLLASGSEISASEFTHRLGSPAQLRFMASSAEGWSAAKPRVTGTQLPNGQLVASLAFPFERDAHGRATSAAVVLDPRQDAPLPERLPLTVRQALQRFLSLHRREVILAATQGLVPPDPKKKALRAR
jgi:hypothetical protein